MQRLNKTSNAPLGAAFFVFLGLAILPFSLRASGVQVSFNPRLAAAMDAWQQVAEVFGVSYQPGTNAELSVVRESKSDAGTQDGSVDAARQLFCMREFQEETSCSKTAPATCPSTTALTVRAAQRAVTYRAMARKQVPSVVVASSVMKNSVVEALNAIKLETDARNSLLKDIEKQLLKQGVWPAVEIKHLTMGKSMKMLVRAKRPAAVSFGKTAQCKVFSAMALEHKAEWERAALIRTSSTAPDNSEF